MPDLLVSIFIACSNAHTMKLHQNRLLIFKGKINVIVTRGVVSILPMPLRKFFREII